MATNLAEYYKSQGQALPALGVRAQIYQEKGLGSAQEYRGSADQNIRLLQVLQSGVPVAPTPQPVPQTPIPQAPAPQPVQQPAPQQAQPAGGDALVQALMAKGYNETDARNAASGPRAVELAREYLGVSGGAGAGITNQPTIDLQALYEKNYNTPEIQAANQKVTEVDAKIVERQKAYDEAVGMINDNPFYSEATRVGKINNLDRKFNADVNTLQNEKALVSGQVAILKADAEMKLNLAIKQFDINSQQAQQSLSQFNSLLSIGALDNISGSEIAALTRSTGLTSSIIQGAIDASRKSKEVKPEMVSYDDGTNQGFVLIDPKTGEILKKQVVAQSKPPAAKEPSEANSKRMISDELRKDAQGGLTLTDAFRVYTGYLEPDLILQLYNANSRYGPAEEDSYELAERYGTKAP